MRLCPQPPDRRSQNRISRTAPPLSNRKIRRRRVPLLAGQLLKKVGALVQKVIRNNMKSTNSAPVQAQRQQVAELSGKL